jgi:hypothetical protein
MTATCEKCGQPRADGDAYCGHCGTGAVPAVPAGSAPAGGWSPVMPATAVAAGNGAAGRPGSSADAGVGQTTPNATYLGQRLLFEKEPEASFDPLLNDRFLFRLARQAGLFIGIYMVAGFALLIACLILDLLGARFFLEVLYPVGATVSSTVFLVTFLLIPVPALLSEWKFLVDDKAAVRPVAFEHVYSAFQRRRVPLDGIRVRRLNLAGREARDYLELRRGMFTGFISCFEQGSDLYVGWTFWVNLAPGRFLVMVVRRTWDEIRQRGNDLYVTLRYESAKALRESMHSAVREGIDVAAGRVAAQGQGSLRAVAVSTTELPA